MFIDFKVKEPWTKLHCLEGDEPPTPPNPNPNPVVTPPVTPLNPRDDVAAALRAENERLKKDAEIAAEKNRQAEQRLAEIERQELEETGNWKKIAEKEGERAEKAVSEATERTTRANQRVIDAELKARLAQEGVEDLDYHVLADKTKLALDGDNVTGLDDVIKDLRARKPHIFKRAAVSTTKDATKPPPTPESERPAIDVRKMSPEEYAKHKLDTIRGLRRVK